MICRIIDHLKKIKLSNTVFSFSMTTNAMLLDKYMDYLVEHNFQIVISLDGNEKNHSCRIDKKGRNSFGNVLSNIDKLKEKYPVFFKNNVNFNAVLHNRNSVEEIYDFILKKYGKQPDINEMMEAGVSDDKRDIFNRMFNSFSENIKNITDHEISKNMFMKLPTYREAYLFISKYAPNAYQTYNELLYNKKTRHVFTNTGTCIPFSRKIFVAAKGHILPCERIGHQYVLGNIREGKAEIDFEMIAKIYNSYYDKMYTLCASCFQKKNCGQCLFHLDDIDNFPACRGFMTKKQFGEYFAKILAFFEKNPDDYERLLNEATIE
jgi:uncharacterized protein